MTKALIDGDIICYSIAFAAKDEPVEYVLSTVKRFLKNTTEKAGCDEYQVYLTGENNFRIDIAKHKPYKGNRKQEKPDYYQTIRDYLTIEQDAIIHDGIEADDALGLDQTDTSVICTIDKDLRMIPGHHYNWNKEWLDEVTQEEGDRFFMEQWLSGDATDNIAGVKGIGPKKAQVALEDCTTLHQMHEVVKDIFFDKGHSAEYMEEMGHLIFIQRKDALTYKVLIENTNKEILNVS